MLLYGDLGRTVSAYLPIHLLTNVCLLVMKQFFIALRTSSKNCCSEAVQPDSISDNSGCQILQQSGWFS